MRTIIHAITLVFSDRNYILAGIISALTFGAIFVASSGMVTFFPEGPFIEFNLLRFGTLAILMLLSGLVVPLQIFAIRKARSTVRTAAGGLGGMLTGIATMSCCAPLLLPSLLSLIGFSGTQLLFLNAAIRRFALPLSLLAVGLLVASLAMASRSVAAACRLDSRLQVR